MNLPFHEQQQPLLTIQDEHKSLLLQLGEAGDVELEKVQAFLHVLAQAGIVTDDGEERSLLHELIRYWSSFIDNKTGEFPVVLLQPFDSSLSASKHSLSLDRSNSGITFPTIWQVPYLRNPFFIGREDLLFALSNTLQANHSAVLSQPQAINGLGGIGKTQLAIEYAYRFVSEYQSVFWVNAETQETLFSGYAAIATDVGLKEKDEPDISLTYQSVQRWLQTHTDWLLILDNADDLSLAQSFIPLAPTGHVLLTTRAHSTGRLARRLEVSTLNNNQGVLLLLRRAGIVSEQDLLEKATPQDIEISRQICEELGNLPLAIDQAGAYIEETGCGLLSYYEQYQQSRQYLLQRRGGIVLDHPEATATTWSLSFAMVEQQNPLAAQMLRFCAFLASDAIPEDLLMYALVSGVFSLKQNRLEKHTSLSTIEYEAWKIEEAIAALRAYSLIQRDTGDHTISIHRLVQAVLRDAMEKDEYTKWIKQVIKEVNAVFPSVSFETWPLCEIYLPHAMMCAVWIEQENVISLEGASLLNNAGKYLYARGHYQEAEPLLKRAISIREHELGPKHSDTASTLNDLAELYRVQGKYEQAQSLHEQALAIRELMLGPQHPDTAVSLNNLVALLYESQGRYPETDFLYQRALSISKHLLGPLHLDAAISLDNLAGLYESHGRYEEAEPLFQRALSLREQQLGANHPDTARSLNNLASLYEKQGRYEEAEPLFQRALSLREQQLGANHPDTASSLNSLAFLYEKQGRYEEAEALYLHALSIRKHLLGPDHPATAISLNNLAMVYQHQGKYPEAEASFLQALAIRRVVLGEHHPDTANSLNNLGMAYMEQGKYSQAEPMLLQTLAIYRAVLGEHHPDTAQILNDLAMLYQTQGKYKEAEPLLERALRIWEQVLGPQHPDTAQSLNNLAMLYQAQGKVEKPEPLLERALRIWEQVLGPQHPNTAQSLNNLAALYDSQGKFVQAEPLYERALRIREQVLGPQHPSTAQSLNNLAMLYREQGMYTEAEPLFQRALAICEQALGMSHPTTKIMRANYTALLEKRKQEQETDS